VIRFNILEVGSVAALGAAALLMAVAGPAKAETPIATLDNGARLYRVEGGCRLVESDGYSTNHHMTVTQVYKDQALSFFAVFDPAYSLPDNEKYPYTIDIEGLKSGTVTAATTTFNGMHGIMFLMHGNDALDFADHNVSFVRDGKVVWRIGFGGEAANYNRLKECAAEDPNPFAR